MSTERGRGDVEHQKNFTLLDMTLQKLAEASNKDYDQKFLTEYRKRLGEMLWSVLPTNVIELDLGGNARISRIKEQIIPIPVHKREIWNLMKIDQYTANIAKSIDKPYIAKFLPPQGRS